MDSMDRKETYHNFMEDKKLYMWIGGHLNITTFPYKLYVAFIIFGHFYVIANTLAAAIIITNNSTLRMNALQVCLLQLFSFAGIASRLLFNEDLNKAAKMIQDGIYHYDKEVLDEECSRIQKDAVSTIRFTAKTNRYIFLANLWDDLGPMFLIKYFMSDGCWVHPGINPYLQEPIYMPFDSSTPAGFVLAYLINAFFFVSLIFIVISMDEIYFGCCMNLVGQIRILNYSLKTIEKRAYLNLARRRGWPQPDGSPPMSIYKDEEFQDTLHDCLKANIRHHEAILEFKKTFESYTSGCVLSAVALAAVIYAVTIFVVIENDSVFEMIIFTCQLIAELMYSFQFCYFGELVLQESSQIFHQLYETPWYLCNPPFKKDLCFMLCHTRRPIKITCIGFNITASFQFFGDIVTTMYKLVNITRQKD